MPIYSLFHIIYTLYCTYIYFEFDNFIKSVFEKKATTNSVKGVVTSMSDVFIKGTSTIKKNNFNDHVKRSQTYATAVLRVTEARKASREPSSSFNNSTSVPSGAPKQTTLYPYMQKLNARQS